MKTVALDLNRQEKQIAALHLFHAISSSSINTQVSFDAMLKYGVILMNSNGTPGAVDSKLADVIVDTLGLKGIDWAQSFHKGWSKVATTSIEQLIAEQVLNYLSTYGLESMGLKAMNYVPVEKILVDLDSKPALESFVVVRILSDKELAEEVRGYLKNTRAPHKDQIEYVKTLLPLAGDIGLDAIKSFELKIMYCDLKDLVPVEAQDFLRYAVYKASSGQITTLVKDRETIELLKAFASTPTAELMFSSADLVELSKSFHRFKPLFLAFKANRELAPAINKIRRLAEKNHVPVSGFAIADIMNLLTQGNRTAMKRILDSASARDLIKLYNFAISEVSAEAHVYNIRNGKIFIKPGVSYINRDVRTQNLESLLNSCKARLGSRLANVCYDKKFYIPKGIDYAAPVSEKQMLDVLPYGTKIYLPEDVDAFCIAGHWMNDLKVNPDEDGRIDLDFHMSSVRGAIGWNSSYRTESKDILFSGDMTDAPAPYGAVEAFRISSSADIPYVLSVNVYNVYNVSGDIPYELLFIKDVSAYFVDRATVSAVTDVTNAIAPTLKLHLHGTDAVVGYYHDKEFTIYGGELDGGRRVPKRELVAPTLAATVNRCDTMLSLSEVIRLAGGAVITEKPTDDTAFVDLSPSNLTPSTLFNIVDGVEL